MVRSGYIGPINSAGTALGVGSNGYGWSRSAVAFSSPTSATVYSLVFYATRVYPSNGPFNRWDGFPLRCLSTALEG